jgi:flagellar L-ring protein precursor FlgH
MRALPHLVAALLMSGAGACSSLDRLKNVGEAPRLSAIENPTAQPGYRPVSMPMPNPQPVMHHTNSLWRTGSRAFFKDQRANNVGDILTVRVRITDRANIDNTTTRSRTNGESGSLGGQVGGGINSAVTAGLGKLLPQNQVGGDADALLTVESASNSRGAGSVRRQEQLLTNVAAVVTQVLPNGNLVIEGKQEIRVNFEIRELIVAGVVRPEDIEAGNEIESTKIAQARIAYGGRGQITDVQQPRYGQQVMDILLPF